MSSMVVQRKHLVVLGDTSIANHHGCWLVMRRLIEGLEKRGLKILYRHSGKNWRADQQLLECLRDADALIINGEGSLHHQSKMTLEYLAAAEYAKELGIPTFLVNTTWCENGPELTQRASVFEKIYVRESNSAKELSTQGAQSVVVPDLTLATNLENHATFRNGFLITDSTYKSLSRQLLSLTFDIPNAQFFPVVSTDWSRATPRRRYKRMMQFALGRALDRARIRPYSLYRLVVAERKAESYLNRLANAESLLTGRFHSACLALITETPFLAIASNTPKIESLIRDAGLSPSRIIQINQKDSSAIRELLANSQYSKEELHNLRDYLNCARSSIEEMFQTIAEHL